MATTPTGIEVPAGTDAFDPQGDMVDLANSLRSRIVVPAANATARAALLTAINWTPTSLEPLRVRQADTGEIWEHLSISGPGRRYHTPGLVWTARKGGVQSLQSSAYTNILSVTLPSDAPAGVYTVHAAACTYSSAAVQHFRKVQWAGGDLPGATDGFTVPAGMDYAHPQVVHRVTHAGGAATITLLVQVNGAGALANAANALQVTYLGTTPPS